MKQVRVKQSMSEVERLKTTQKAGLLSLKKILADDIVRYAWLVGTRMIIYDCHFF